MNIASSKLPIFAVSALARHDRNAQYTSYS